MAKKQRADQLVHMQGLAESREQAKRLIMAGQIVFIQGENRIPVDKPGQQFSADILFERLGQERFVSRGGYKLLTAIEHFSLNVNGAICLDAGSSTGGFTDCLLQHGAKKVYAVDVGKHQLHERLRADHRVVSLEGVNLRHADSTLLPEPVSVIVADVSFISLTLVLEPCMQWLEAGGIVAALIKPQFEVGPGGTEKGVVKDLSLRDAAIQRVLGFAEATLRLKLSGVVPSSIKGPKGNQEYMAVWQKPEGKE